MEENPKSEQQDPFSKLRGSNSSLDYSSITPVDYEDAAAEQDIEALLDQFEDAVADTIEGLTWPSIGIAAAFSGAVWLCTWIFGGWFLWIFAILTTVSLLIGLTYRAFRLWLLSKEKELEQIWDRSLPTLFQFGDIARHFAVKGDEENYDKFVSRYRELLETGSNDPESRAGKEKMAVVREWAVLTVEMEENAASAVDVIDELHAENIRKNFGTINL